MPTRRFDSGGVEARISRVRSQPMTPKRPFPKAGYGSGPTGLVSLRAALTRSAVPPIAVMEVPDVSLALFTGPWQHGVAVFFKRRCRPRAGLCPVDLPSLKRQLNAGIQPAKQCCCRGICLRTYWKVPIDEMRLTAYCRSVPSVANNHSQRPLAQSANRLAGTHSGRSERYFAKRH